MSDETLGSQGGQCVYGVALAERYGISQFMTHGNQSSNGSSLHIYSEPQEWQGQQQTQRRWQVQEHRQGRDVWEHWKWTVFNISD